MTNKSQICILLEGKSNLTRKVGSSSGAPISPNERRIWRVFRLPSSEQRDLMANQEEFRQRVDWNNFQYEGDGPQGVAAGWAWRGRMRRQRTARSALRMQTTPSSFLLNSRSRYWLISMLDTFDNYCAALRQKQQQIPWDRSVRSYLEAARAGAG